MSLLAACYLGSLPGASAGSLKVADLESLLSALHSRGAAAHPDLAVPEEIFARHLARCRAVVSASGKSIHAEDLFLACAALTGQGSAVDALMSAHAPAIAKYLCRIASVGRPLAEITQQVWELLLVGDGRKPPRLLSYAGRGQLGGFVGICAQRLALSDCRQTAAQKRALATARAEEIAVGRDPELAIIKERYRAGFQQVVSEATDVLDDRERMILRMLVVDGRSMDSIAEVYGVNQSSVSRWLDKARKKVLAEAQRLLKERLNVAPSEFDSLARVIWSQVDLSVSKVLGDPPLG